MIISEKQISTLIRIIEDYRAWLLHKEESKESVHYINTILFEISQQQSDELKVIE